MEAAAADSFRAVAAQAPALAPALPPELAPELVLEPAIALACGAPTAKCKSTKSPHNATESTFGHRSSFLPWSSGGSRAGAGQEPWSRTYLRAALAKNLERARALCSHDPLVRDDPAETRRAWCCTHETPWSSARFWTA